MITKNKLTVLVLLTICIFSCTVVYVSSPIPSDARNIYTIPRQYRGVWFKETDSVVITKRDISMIYTDQFNITQAELDTVTDAFIFDNEIYIDNFENGLMGGYPYTFSNDTFYYTDRSVDMYAMSSALFLRKANRKYLLNMREKDGWYMVYYVSKIRNDCFALTKINDERLKELSDYKEIYRIGQQTMIYMKGTMTKKELTQMMDQGLYQDTLFCFCKDLPKRRIPVSTNAESIQQDSTGQEKIIEGEEEYPPKN